jgi:hypothetical protein
MITIFLLVLLFLFIVYLTITKKEGLTNQYKPINVTDETATDFIYKKLTQPTESLYEPKYLKMDRNDILLDMKYFNNASNIIFAYKAKNIGVGV